MIGEGNSPTVSGLTVVQYVEVCFTFHLIPNAPLLHLPQQRRPTNDAESAGIILAPSLVTLARACLTPATVCCGAKLVCLCTPCYTTYWESHFACLHLTDRYSKASMATYTHVYVCFKRKASLLSRTCKSPRTRPPMTPPSVKWWFLGSLRAMSTIPDPFQPSQEHSTFPDIYPLLAISFSTQGRQAGIDSLRCQSMPSYWFSLTCDAPLNICAYLTLNL